MEFVPIDIRLDPACAADQVFIKLHVRSSSGKTEDNADNDLLRPAKRTLLVVGVPAWCTDENSLRSLFSVFGDIHSVFIQDAPGPVKHRPDQPFSFFDVEHNRTNRLGFKVAYIAYKKRASVTIALDYGKQPVKNSLTLITTPDEGDGNGNNSDKRKVQPPLLGLKKWYHLWHAHARRNANEAALEKEINAFMGEYDTRKADEKRKAKETEGQPDAEGWVTVSRHGRKATISRAEAMRNSVFAGDQQNTITTKSGGRRGKRKVVAEPATAGDVFMYKNQAKESKMDQLMELRRKFEDDKKRLALMKAARKFKPY